MTDVLTAPVRYSPVPPPLPPMQPPPLPPGRPPAPGGDPAAFASDGKGFLKLLVRGTLLEVVTFGFYRFWLTTDIRRHLWSHTSIDGESLEYTGRGRELLIGFLVALAILLPIYVVYFLIGIEVERLRAFASLPLFIFMFLFGQFAVFRARRYRLTRTLWRGVRFWMNGSGWAYAGRAILWDFLVMITLGLAWPWRVAALERYKMRHTYYGTLQGGFVGTGWRFLARGWWIWVICMLALVGLAALAAIGIISAEHKGKAVSTLPGFAALVTIAVASIPCMVAAPFLWPVFRAIEWRWWAQGLRIGAVEVDSTFRKRTILVLYLKSMVISWVVSAALGMLAFAVAAFVLDHMGVSLSDQSPAGKAAMDHFFRDHAILATGGGIGMYLVILLAIGVVQRFFFLHEMWRMVVASLSFKNLEAAANVEAVGRPASAIGEGLLDGLDIGGM